MPNMARKSKNTGLKSDQERDTITQDKDSALQASAHWTSIVRAIVVISLACAAGLANSLHVSTLFENDRHFSHLSTLEREMTFRTEMGLYYSYYKTLIESPSVLDGIHALLHDNRTEYPDVINTLRRFNLYPEIVLGLAFRIYKGIADQLGLTTRTCWMVYRGKDLPDAESCEGLGEPTYFYVNAVFLWNGLLSAAQFLYGLFLSDSLLGGVLCVLCFFYNHGDSTRVQWTPPLRESFAYPIFLWQMLVTSVALRKGGSTIASVAIIFLTVAFHLCWQFAQFALLTQCTALFMCYAFGQCISAQQLRSYLVQHVIALFTAYLLLFQNEMLLTSFYASFLLSAAIVVQGSLPWQKQHSVPIWKSLVLMMAAVMLSVLIKFTVCICLRVTNDAHVWNLLMSKITGYRDFHTMLYTCAVEFDFLDYNTVLSLTKTLLIPCSLVCTLSCIYGIIVKPGCRRSHTDALYNTLQAAAFCIMAGFIMRLKLFMTPHLCIVSSLAASRSFFGFIQSKRIHTALVVGLLSVMTVQGVQNISNQRSIIGEYSNPDLEELLLWVNQSTPPNAVFAGPMPTMANLLLSTRRPIVNHPHYEHAGLRERTRKVYSVYSRRTPSELHAIISSLQAQYLVLGYQWCHRHMRPGCGLTDIWDTIEGKQQDRQPVCATLEGSLNPMPFKRVFTNEEYTILKL